MTKRNFPLSCKWILYGYDSLSLATDVASCPALIFVIMEFETAAGGLNQLAR